MLDTSSQWIFVVSNLNDSSTNMSKITTNIGTGGNVALAINITNSEHCVVKLFLTQSMNEQSFDFNYNYL